MSVIFAISPGLMMFGPLLVALGIVGLAILPVARNALRRVTMTGAAVTMLAVLPQVAINGLASPAHADGHAAAAPASQQIMLSGMTSQIIYGIAE